MNLTLKWHRHFLREALLLAELSEDPNTKVGAVIVDPVRKVRISSGYNGIPQGIAHKPFMNVRPEKYDWYEHAERNALNFATVDTTGMVMYLNFIRSETSAFEGNSCYHCARGLVQNGITHLFVPKGINTHNKVLEAAGVKIVSV